MARASISAKDFNKIPVVGLVPESSGSAPGSPVQFQFWGDTATGKLKWTNNGSTFLDPLDRANHTGTQLANTISNFNAAVQAISISSLAAATAPLDLGNQRAINGATPIADSDLATKKYVDDARAGLSTKDPVRAALTTNVNVSAPGGSLDGLTPAVDERYLLTGQTTSTQNGIYLYKGSAVAMVRSADADATGEIVDGSLVAVAEGTNAGKQYIQTASPSGAPGAWTQVWTVYSVGGQTYTADGQGMELSGTTFSLELADATLSKSASGLTVGLVTVAKGGTGGTDAATARANLGTAGIFSVLLGTVTAGTPVTVTHNLNRQYPQVSVWDVDNNAEVDADVKSTGVNTVTVTSALAFATGKIHVVVVG
jgi:hypothetical protein